ncbi:hypothetical protein [Alteromonas sp. RKMC-009]|uniref:hypothetical protein n=1 Tax=Alteromonas sp. RKMC-009 TaxID=2267264 RepID=UPI000E67E4C0|nr:hypothetical protein [Alteromonas sp. RKMC-009]AYA63847.1 hypothetical protein DS731_07435 [Alteromonas sp. RKMC-009]
MDDFTTLNQEQLATLEYTIAMLRDELKSQIARELLSRQSDLSHFGLGSQQFSDLVITLMPTLERLAEYLISHLVLELLVDIAVSQPSRPDQ